MTKEEYFFELTAIKIDRIKQISELNQKFVLANSKIKLGDMIKEGKIRIQVDSIGPYMSSFHIVPICRYSGYVFTKEGKQRKDQRRETIYQNESIKIL